MTVTRVAVTVPARPDISIATGSPSRTLASDACGSVAVTRRSLRVEHRHQLPSRLGHVAELDVRCADDAGVMAR